MPRRLPGRAIQAGTITVTQLETSVATTVQTGGGPKITNVQVTSNSYVVLDDTAVDIAGGYIKITGTGFAAGCQVLINNTPATSTTFIGPTEVRAQLPATAAGTYMLYLINADGGVAIRVNGVTFSATPSWVTASDLTSYALGDAISIQLSATGASTFALAAGSTLPTGLTLSAGGLLSGSVTGLENDTSYSFTITATDAENQDSPRTFSITITVQLQVSRSLRFNAPDTTYLARTFPTASNRRLWTLSTWYKRSNLTDTVNGLFQYGPDGNNQFRLHLDTGGTITIMDRISAVYIVSMVTTAVFRDPGAWYHIVVAYDTAQATAADRVKLYINGTQITSFSTPTYPSQNAEGNTNSASSAYIGRGDTTSVYYYSGYMTEMYLIDGQALTPAAFAETNSGTGQYIPKKYTGTYGTNGFYLPFTDNSSVANLGRNYQPLTADPFWPQTVLLLNGTGTNNAQNNTFTDSSTNAFAITRNGNTTQGRFSPFSQTGWGNYFNGSSALDTTNAAFNPAGAFTIEFWFYPTLNTSPEQGLVTTWPSGLSPAQGILIWKNSAGVLEVAIAASGSTSIVATGTWANYMNQWNHCALVRNSSDSCAVFVNGTRLAAPVTKSGSPGQTTLSIGRSFPNTANWYFTGYMSNVSFISGSNVYNPASSTITVPTTPLSTSTANQALLTCQANRFIDSNTATTAKIITLTGSPSVVAFSPFTPTTAYSAATHGGSAYFDGSGDWLNYTNTDNFGTSAFTVQAWIWFSTTASNDSAFIDGRPTGGSSTGYLMAVRNSTKVLRFASAAAYDGVTPLVANTWNHVAATYTGGTLRLYLNGNLDATFTSLSFNFTDTNFVIGKAHFASGEWTGYISGLQLIKGSALYISSTYTVPTSPPTVVSGTSLLVNFTNAGIVDATGDNNIETVGDAKISTAQSKWAGSSMLFDGTGDWLEVKNKDNQAFNFGSGDFTIEGWYNVPNASTQYALVGRGPSDADDELFILLNNGTYYIDWGGGVLYMQGGSYTANAWHHFALVRIGTDFRLYHNGTSVVSTTLTAGYSFTNNYTLKIGSGRGGSYAFNGYIQDLRITRAARYTGNFTPPTAQFAYNQGDINYNQWVPTNFSVTAGAGNDSLLDVPTNWGVDTGLGGEVRGNYATLNPLALGSYASLSNGALDITGTTATNSGGSLATIGVATGKWYFEFTVTSTTSSFGGVVTYYTNNAVLNDENNVYGASGSNKGIGIRGSGSTYGNAAEKQTIAAFTYGTSDIIGVAIDADNGAVYFRVNNTWLNSGVPTSGASRTGSFHNWTPAADRVCYPALVAYNGQAATANFGQRAFAYAAPSGFKSLNTHNLPALAVTKSNTAFETVLYTGNGGTQNITSLGFQPDFVWIKRRDSNWSNAVYDIIRGAGSLKALSTNGTDAEGVFNADTTYGYLSSFNSNGFTVINGTTGGYTNLNGATYAAWAWDVGTTTVVNTAGTLQSNVRVNTTAGISVQTWTAVSGTPSIGHGLNAVPKFIIIKRRSSAQDWYVYHSALANNNDYLLLSSTAAKATYSALWGTGHTTTTFSFSASPGDHVSYCFAEVPGFSAFGSYTGNGSADGPFIYTGFRPRWLLIRRSDTIENWNITDTARDPYNVASLELYPNLTNVEAGSAASYRDFLSNGFKIRGTGGGFNTNGGTYIYAAFAESPFKYARAR